MLLGTRPTMLIVLLSALIAAGYYSSANVQTKEQCEMELDQYIQSTMDVEIEEHINSILKSIYARLNTRLSGAVDDGLESMIKNDIMKRIVSDVMSDITNQQKRKLGTLKSHRRRIVKELAKLKLDLDVFEIDAPREAVEWSTNIADNTTLLEAELHKIQDSSKELDTMVEELKAGLTRFVFEDSIIQEVKTEVNSMFSEMIAINQTLGSLSNSIKATAQEINTMRSEINTPTTPIRYHALLSDYMIRNLSFNEVLKFDKILQNNGGNYDPLTGEFTVPRTGFYSLWGNAITLTGNSLSIEVYKNGGVEHKFGEKGGNAMTSLGHFETGDKLWWQMKEGSFIYTFGIPALEVGTAFLFDE